MVCIFVLLLENDKYYIGSCNDPNNDINKYLTGYGPKWIKKHKPIKIREIISPCDIFDIDKHTKRYMATHGVSNVRGGAYSNLRLSKSDCNHIDKEIFSALGMCMHCGSDNHISIECIHNTFSSQFRQMLNSMKHECYSLKSKISNNISNCVNYIKNNNPKHNKKYDTMVIDNDDVPIFDNSSSERINNRPINNMLLLDSPKRTKEYSDEEVSDEVKFFPTSPSSSSEERNYFKTRHYTLNNSKRRRRHHPLASHSFSPSLSPLPLSPPRQSLFTPPPSPLMEALSPPLSPPHSPLLRSSLFNSKISLPSPPKSPEKSPESFLEKSPSITPIISPIISPMPIPVFSPILEEVDSRSFSSMDEEL